MPDNTIDYVHGDSANYYAGVGVASSGDNPVLKREPTEEVKPWRAEFTTSDVGYVDRWYNNALRFADKDDALKYARDLAFRWTLVTRWRAVDEDVPLDQVYQEGDEDGRW